MLLHTCEFDFCPCRTVDFWSPQSKWPALGVTQTPCPNGGWAHAPQASKHRVTTWSHVASCPTHSNRTSVRAQVALHEWRQRRSKGICRDRGLAGQRASCKDCKVENARLKELLAAAKSQAQRVASTSFPNVLCCHSHPHAHVCSLLGHPRGSSSRPPFPRPASLTSS